MAGPLALMGSGEFEPWALEVDRALLHGSRSGDGSVLVVPTASAPDGPEVFRGWAEQARSHYAALGAPVRVAEVPDRGAAHDPRWADAAAQASMIFISGGKPWFLADTLSDTLLWEGVRDALARGAALAGCSAGMCLLGDLVPDTATHNAHQVRWTAATSLLPGTLTVPHWDAIDDYQPGVRTGVLNGAAGARLVIAVDERTALALVEGTWRVFGRGNVFVARAGEGDSYRPGDEVPIAVPVA